MGFILQRGSSTKLGLYALALLLFEFQGKRPQVHPDSFVAPTAVLIGDVRVASGASIWFGAVLRADQAPIVVGEGSNVQDNAVIHVGRDLGTEIGRDVTVGHGALLEGCVVEDGCVVGMGAIMLQRSRLGAASMLAAGAVVVEDQAIPSGSLAMGVPAAVKKQIEGASAHWLTYAAARYREVASEYREHLKPVS